MLGRFSIGRVGIAIRPTNTIRMLQTVVRTGRLMKLSESDIGGPQFCSAPDATFTGSPVRNSAVLLTTTVSPACSPPSSG